MKIIKIEREKTAEQFKIAHSVSNTITTEDIMRDLQIAREALGRDEREHPIQRIPGEWVIQEDGSELWLTPEEVNQRNREEYRTREQREEEWVRRHEQERIPPATFNEIVEQISERAAQDQLETIKIACIFRETNIRIQEGGAPNEEIIENNEDPQNPRYGNYPL